MQFIRVLVHFFLRKHSSSGSGGAAKPDAMSYNSVSVFACARADCALEPAGAGGRPAGRHMSRACYLSRERWPLEAAVCCAQHSMLLRKNSAVADRTHYECVSRSLWPRARSNNEIHRRLDVVVAVVANAVAQPP